MKTIINKIMRPEVFQYRLMASDDFKSEKRINKKTTYSYFLMGMTLRSFHFVDRRQALSDQQHL